MQKFTYTLGVVFGAVAIVLLIGSGVQILLQDASFDQFDYTILGLDCMLLGSMFLAKRV